MDLEWMTVTGAGGISPTVRVCRRRVYATDMPFNRHRMAILRVSTSIATTTLTFSNSEMYFLFHASRIERKDMRQSGMKTLDRQSFQNTKPPCTWCQCKFVHITLLMVDVHQSILLRSHELSTHTLAYACTPCQRHITTIEFWFFGTRLPRRPYIFNCLQAIWKASIHYYHIVPAIQTIYAFISTVNTKILHLMLIIFDAQLMTYNGISSNTSNKLTLSFCPMLIAVHIARQLQRALENHKIMMKSVFFRCRTVIL